MGGFMDGELCGCSALRSDLSTEWLIAASLILSSIVRSTHFKTLLHAGNSQTASTKGMTNSTNIG